MAYSEEIKKKVMDELEQRKTVAEIAKEYNISRGTIYNWKKKIAGATTIQKEFKRGRKGYSEEIKKQVLSDIKAGKKVSEVASDYQISVSTIYNWRKTIKGAKTVENKFSKPTDEEKRAYTDIKFLIQRKKFEEAKAVCIRFPDDKKTQSQLVEIYIKQGNYEAAKQIAKKFPNAAGIQFKIIEIYILEGKYEEAKKIGQRFPDNLVIQIKMVEIHIREGNYEEAKQIGQKFLNDPVMQIRILTILIKEKNYEEAKSIGKRFLNNPVIQSQMITAYMKEGKIEEAKKIGVKFPKDKAIRTQMARIHEIEKLREREKNISGTKNSDTKLTHKQGERIGEQHTENIINQSSKIEILNRIYNNTNDQTLLEDINNLDDKWLKLILNSALGEKNNIKILAQQFIKKLKQQGQVDEEHTPIIHSLEQRLKQNVKIFDVGFYFDLINEVMKQKSIGNKGTVDTQDGRE